MRTAVFVWFELSVSWTTPSVKTSVGPVIYSSTAPFSLAVEENTLSIEPATIGFEYVSRELEIESRVSAYLLVPTR